MALAWDLLCSTGDKDLPDKVGFLAVPKLWTKQHLLNLKFQPLFLVDFVKYFNKLLTISQFQP